MPLVGLGTYPMKGKVLETAVNTANDTGYLLYDSAWYYRNEKTLGRLYKELRIPRQTLFVQSKLKAEQYLGRKRYLHLNSKDVQTCFKNTLKRYGLDYIDSYVMHSNIDWYIEAVSGLIDLYEAKKVRVIGVCNCTIEQLKRIKAMYGVFPMINQVEMHPYYNRLQLVEFCQENNIQVQAFSPFAHGDYLLDLLHNEELKKLSAKYQKTVCQIIVRWFVQRNISCIPQSANPLHIKENIEVFDFELQQSEINTINTLNKNTSYGSFSTKRAKKFFGITLGH